MTATAATVKRIYPKDSAQGAQGAQERRNRGGYESITPYDKSPHTGAHSAAQKAKENPGYIAGAVMYYLLIFNSSYRNTKGARIIYKSIMFLTPPIKQK